MLTENDIILSPEEALLLTNFRSMNEADQAHMLELAKGLLDGTLSFSIEEFRKAMNKRDY